MADGLRRVRLRNVCIAFAAGAVGLALWQGCTVTRENYSTLSFWFDGVPDPNSETSKVDPTTGVVTKRQLVLVHKPFEEERCTECHAGGEALNRSSSGICLKCHEKVPTEKPRMHGPVAAVACLWCHQPHESTREFLLRDSPRKVCVQCHEPGGLSVVKVPAHADEARSCLECHYGHGGTQAHMLRTEKGVIAPGTPAPVAAEPATPRSQEGGR